MIGRPGVERKEETPPDRQGLPLLYLGHMLHLAIALSLSAAPALILLFWIYRRDKARPEPLGLVWKSAIYGFLAVIPAAALEFFLGPLAADIPGSGGDLLQAFVVAGLVEEGVKLAFLRFYLFRRPEFDERMDGVVYAICVSLGFAFVENFLYGYRDPGLLILRGFTSVPLHAIATGIMGYWLGRAKIDGLRDGDARLGRVWKRGLLWAVGIHGLYDFLLLSGSLTALLVFPLLIVGWLGLRRLIRKALALDSADPKIAASQSGPGSLP
jgi:RsiW-degrading membrane proteinase PrsW (M82 family)